MEFPDGLSVSVPQLARLCASVRFSLRCSHRCPQLYAGEPAFLPGGQQRFRGNSDVNCCLIYRLVEGENHFGFKGQEGFLFFPPRMANTMKAG